MQLGMGEFVCVCVFEYFVLRKMQKSWEGRKSECESNDDELTLSQLT